MHGPEILQEHSIYIHSAAWETMKTSPVSEIKDTFHKKLIQICYMLFICVLQSICMICLFVFSNKNTRNQIPRETNCSHLNTHTRKHTHTHAHTHTHTHSHTLPEHLQIRSEQITGEWWIRLSFPFCSRTHINAHAVVLFLRGEKTHEGGIHMHRNQMSKWFIRSWISSPCRALEERMC